MSISRRQLKRLRKRAVPAAQGQAPAGTPAGLGTLHRRAHADRREPQRPAPRPLGASRRPGLAHRLADALIWWAGIEALDARLTALETAFGELETSLADLLDRLDLLEAALPDPAQIAELVTNVESLLTRVTSLENLTTTLQGNLTTLTGTVTTLQGSVTTLQGRSARWSPRSRASAPA